MFNIYFQIYVVGVFFLFACCGFLEACGSKFNKKSDSLCIAIWPIMFVIFAVIIIARVCFEIGYFLAVMFNLADEFDENEPTSDIPPVTKAQIEFEENYCKMMKCERADADFSRDSNGFYQDQFVADCFNLFCSDVKSNAEVHKL